MWGSDDYGSQVQGTSKYRKKESFAKSSWISWLERGERLMNHKQLVSLTPKLTPYKRGLGNGLSILVDPKRN